MRLTGWRNIYVADGCIGTNTDAFLASFACLGMIDMRVSMLEKHDLSKDLVGAYFHAFPAGLAFAGVDRNKLRAQMT